MDNLQSFTNNSNTASPQTGIASQQNVPVTGLGAGAIDQRQLTSSSAGISLSCQTNCSLGVSTRQPAVDVKPGNANGIMAGAGLLLAVLAVGIFAHRVLKS